MDIADLSDLLNRIEGCRVLCVGDLVIDQFVYGETRRVSREAPVPILDEKRRETMLGAAGNVIRNVVALGGKPVLVSVVGDDPEGQTAASLLQAEGVDPAGLLAIKGGRTGTKTRFVCNGHQMLCVDRDPDGTLSAADTAALLDRIRAAAQQADVAILSDYGRGLVSRDVSQGLIAACREAGIRVCVDPRGKDYSRYDGASIIKPNALELTEETGIDIRGDDSALAALDAAMARLERTDAIIVTRSSAGMTVRERSGETRHVRSRPRQVYDVSGAGDTAISMLSLALGAGAGLHLAMRAADRAAGVAVGKVGTATVSAAEILDDERAQGFEDARTKLLTADAAAQTAARWRAHGLKVGLTNGCFDILHPGHVSLLRQARAECDRLIVALNSDASVKRLKGEGRPVNNEVSRATVLASLASVDRVVIFGEDTPADLIEALAPDLYFKGADYTVEQLRPLGGDAVERHGGRIHLIPLEDGHSTTSTLARVARSKS
ncbi:D-glycero-beta-D-manno-heptose 1-phosphate adenylyltransferase [Hyphobacterium marinum]|uniref:Bifunctional protein HldE n=1 Tax=Hyphobacterium marinum TaxID=3116574 RepID=A0ABU7LYJ3_9PROT|nr:D-glycero-beta-D-manno-heptose 1-phosphate adenylyltransferase [Hyphobacterium sp. Y6023]MEE2566633.1 D-glycero-beta-D-manno-heptose 1-phosphate adenylyltransferase [Hyphobacterium sp. Y6023]